jgi:hypothetical protein
MTYELKLIKPFPEEWSKIISEWFSYGMIGKYYLCKFKEDKTSYYLYNHYDDMWQDFGKMVIEIEEIEDYAEEVEKLMKIVLVKEVIE